MTYDVVPWQVHGTLLDVAADGDAMVRAAKDAGTSADVMAGGFGTATDVGAAFSAFWTARDETALRVGGLLFRKSTAVADAAQAFVEADGEMTATARNAVSSLPADFVSARRGGPQTLE